MLIPTSFYLVRCSSFTIDDFNSLNKAVSQQDINGIKAIFRNQKFFDAIFFSSRFFYKTAKDWLQNDKIVFDSNDKVLITLYKYYTRICTRSTPYGLFAGFSMGNITDCKTEIEFSDELHTPIFRIDMLFLQKLKNDILANIKSDKITYFTNNTLYKVGACLRYIDWDQDYNYEISQIPNTIELGKVFELTNNNGATFSEIASLIENEVQGVEKIEAEEYVSLLIDNKILINDSPPYITSSEDPIIELEKYFKKVDVSTAKLKPIIEFLKKNSSVINNQEIEALIQNYQEFLGNDLHPFQVDLKVGMNKNNIRREVLEKISKHVQSLLVLVRNNNSRRMVEFCDRFSNKFDSKEIPLLHALDPQLGVGYDLQISGNLEDTPLVRDIAFSYKNENLHVEVHPIINLILERYIHHFDTTNQKPIILQEEDLKKAAVNKEPMPLANDYCLFGDILTKSIDDLDEGEFRFFSKGDLPIPYMSNILSRFAYHDEELRLNIQSNLPNQESTCIYAEVIHQAINRAGNLLLHPNFYEFEISLLAESKKDKVRIDINDVFVSVNDNKITLRSKSLDREILPRLSTAYNYEQSQLSILKFLNDFQYHKIQRGFFWDWSILNDRVYLPRVEYKNLILSEARWQLDINIVKNITNLKPTLKQLNVPRYCRIKDGDNILLLDTENELSLNIIWGRIKTGTVFLYESFHEFNFLKNRGENYATEFVFPLIASDKQFFGNTNLFVQNECEVPRDFYPGSEWSSFKIYCSHIVGERIIREVLYAFVNNYSPNINNSLFWFYLRYRDPEHHIRFRVKEKCSTELILFLYQQLQPLIEEGYVFSVEIDTYKREIERYGARNIELSEQLFYYDSLAMMEIVELLDSTDENNRWKVGIASIDVLLDDFNISLNNRIFLFDELHKAFMLEYVDKENIKSFKNSINKQLRTHKHFLDNIIRLKSYGEIDVFITPLRTRSQRIKCIADIIQSNSKTENSMLNLLKSYIHMSLNRLFYTKARMHELVIYYYMYHSYQSIYHRNDK